MAEEDNKYSFVVSVDGSDLEGAMLKQVRTIRVDQIADGPDMFDLTVRTEDDIDLAFPNDAYKIAAEVEIKLGPSDAPETVFKGEIVRIDATFKENEAPTFTISGFDKLHRLTRGRLTEHWEQVKYSDVASDVAGKKSLSAKTDSTDITFDYISMNNQNYLAFLQELARRVGFEVGCDDGDVTFKKPLANTSSVATLTYGTNLTRAKFRAQTSGQMTKVRVFALDDKENSQVIGEATGSDVSPTLGGSTTGPDQAKSDFGDAEFWVSSYAAKTQAEVDEVAKSMINEIAHRFVRVEAECEGDPAIKAGTVVTFDKVSGHFNGDYYVMRATHRYDIGAGPGKGYHTIIHCSRPAWTV